MSVKNRITRMDNRLFIHNDIKEAAKHYNIPFTMWYKDDIYIMQEDRCVFVGTVGNAVKWVKINEDKYCKSRFPL